jgi:hypothetical protein
VTGLFLPLLSVARASAQSKMPLGKPQLLAKMLVEEEADKLYATV